MTNLTKEEREWVCKLQKVLNKCPSDRLGCYTTGDQNLVLYDKSSYEQYSIKNGDPFTDENQYYDAIAIASACIDSSIVFPFAVEGVSG